MLDGQVQTDMTPTYDNIVRGLFCFWIVITNDIFKLRQIDNMVRGAQAGDHFFFACLSPLSPLPCRY